jgi:hypothetical protein
VTPSNTHNFHAQTITVTTGKELGQALCQRERPIIIANELMMRIFELFERVQQLPLPAAMIAYSISKAYQVKFSHTAWRARRNRQHKLVLTPCREE